MSSVELDGIAFVRPTSLEHACDVLASAMARGEKAWPIAGCTDWMVERRSSGESAPVGTAVDVMVIPELRGIRMDGDRMSIGAAEPYLAISRNPLVCQRCDLLMQMALGVGARQVQARGTLGGNLVSGSPAADGVAALFALDADVVLGSVRGERVVPVTEFYRGYRTTVCAVDELVVRLEFRVPSEGAVQMWRKVGTRRALAVSKVTVAAVGEVDGGVVSRVGLGVGSVAEVVLPMVGVRREAAGKTVGKSGGKSVGNCDFNAFWNALEQAVETEIRPIDDLRSTARYRRHVAKVLIRRFFQALWGDE